ncbi:MAG: hypothetical protein LUE27_01500, partial [Clostridia bacterium]|nr:hypothetical protein [Clostridia bacterium]
VQIFGEYALRTRQFVSNFIHEPGDPTVIEDADEDEEPPVIIGTWKYSVKISRIDEIVAYMDWDEG